MTDLDCQDHPGASSRSRSSTVLDGSRRRIIRAAAVAPLLATIPSGAAFANTSAFQCVAASKEDSDNQIPTMSQSSSDSWVRRPAKVRPFATKVGGTLQRYTGYSLDLSGTDEGRTWYDQNGIPLSPNWNIPCDRDTSLCPAGVTTDTLVLAIYEPLPDGVTPTSIEPKGFYPITSTYGNRPNPESGTPDTTGNIGLVQSCYCSVYPTITNPDADQQALHRAYCDL